MQQFHRLRDKMKHNPRIYRVLGRIYGIRRNLIMISARRRQGIDHNLVVFSAFSNRAYNDNPRYVSEKLHEMRPQTDIVWLFDDVADARKKYPIPDYVRCVPILSREGLIAQGRARVFLDNFCKRTYIRLKTPDQEYIQTWHGDRAFKKVGYDFNPLSAKMCEEKYCTLGVCGSDYGERQLRSAFHIRCKIMRCGYPRNDILIRNDPAEGAAIRARLKLDADTGILLYAPTFRDVCSRHRAAMPIPLDLTRALDHLERRTGKKWVCLIRAHYLSYGVETDARDDRLLQVSDYPEMAELLRVADALVTDYSSCAGDFALTRRPIFLYQNDLEDYLDNNRQMYFDMKTSPYWVATNPDELDALIDQYTPGAAAQNCDEILKFYGECETGRASEMIAEYIIDKLK